MILDCLVTSRSTTQPAQLWRGCGYPPAEEEYDAISIEGVPSLHMKLTPCIHGDVGTVAMVVNSIAKMQGPTGLGYHERLTYSFGRA